MKEKGRGDRKSRKSRRVRGSSRTGKKRENGGSRGGNES